MAVITISRQVGSRGDEIVDRLCQVLGYQQFDKRLITQAAEESGLSNQEAAEIRFEDYSEENRKVTTFLARLFSRQDIIVQAKVWRDTPTGGEATIEQIRLSEESIIALVEHAIRIAYSNGNCIIVGRGGQAILKDKPDVLHVRLIAPFEHRIQQVKEQFRHSRQSFHADIELRRDAQDWITGRDEASADYLRRFYDIDWNDPSHYHLVINTSKVSLEQSVDMIARMVSEIKAANSVAAEG